MESQLENQLMSFWTHERKKRYENAMEKLESILVYKKEETISSDVKMNIVKYAKWSRRMDKAVHQMMKVN